MDLIIYHNNCPDGFTAAYIAKLRYPDAQLLPRDHGLNPPYAEVEDKDVLVVDFSWRTREENIRLSKLAKSFRILDHHKTAEAELRGLDFAVFDMERSGAGLAWDYLFGKDSNRPPVETPTGLNWKFYTQRPWFVNYVEDRDLWRFRLPYSKEVNSYIMTFEYTLEAWEKMTKIDIVEAMTAGKAVELQVAKYVREASKQLQATLWEVNGNKYSVGIVNVPYLNVSEVGHAIVQAGYDIGIGWFERGDGVLQFSLRSQGDVDVSAIAKLHRGGGHKNAAGFQLNLSEGRALIDAILNRK